VTPSKDDQGRKLERDAIAGMLEGVLDTIAALICHIVVGC